MKSHEDRIAIRPNEEIQFTDITREIKGIVKKSNIRNGIASVYSTHTTSCIKINENEPRLIDDFKRFLEELAPCSRKYRHDDLHLRDTPPDERINGHSHCKSMLLNSSETIPITNHELQFGEWQSVFHVDLDGRGRKRNVIVKIIGE